MEVQQTPVVDAAAVLPAAPVSHAAAPAQSPAPAEQPHAEDSGIAPAIAKLFGQGSPEPAQLNVSYRVEGKDIVTVFTDPKTGKEVAQFPPEILLGLAKFFDQQSGVTFDKNA